MNSKKLCKLLGVALLVVAGAIAGLAPGWLSAAHPQERTITITAHKYGYEPSVLRINRGDIVHIHLVAQDVTHGFYLEGYGIDAKMRPQDSDFWLLKPSTGEPYAQVHEVTFVADKAGKFHYRCSQTCGYMHPFMQGELIVSPNSLFGSSVGMSFGLALGMLLMFRQDGTTSPAAGADEQDNKESA